MGTAKLDRLSVFLSASISEELVGTARAQDFFDFLVVVTGSVLSAGGRLIFGGHPSVTPLLHRVVGAMGLDSPRVALFQLAAFKSSAPAAIHDTSVFEPVRWFGEPGDTRPEAVTASLRSMREAMAASAGSAIIAGGKMSHFVGTVPGIWQEYEVFVASGERKPVYLLGLLEGAALQLIERHERDGAREHNGLSTDELRSLHRTRDVDLAAALILGDLLRGDEAPAKPAKRASRRRR